MKAVGYAAVMLMGVMVVGSQAQPGDFWTDLENASCDEANVDGWGSQAEYDGTEGHDAAGCLKLTDPDGGEGKDLFNNGFWGAIVSSSDIEAGFPGPISLSYWYKIESGFDVSVFYNIFVRKMDYSSLTWLGWHKMDPFDVGEWAQVVDEGFDAFNTVASYSSLTYGEKVAAKMEEWGVGEARVTMSLRSEVKDATVYYDDFVLVQEPTGINLIADRQRPANGASVELRPYTGTAQVPQLFSINGRVSSASMKPTAASGVYVVRSADAPRMLPLLVPNR